MKNNINNLDDPRRTFLIKALRIGLYSIGATSHFAQAGFFGNTPEKLAAGKSFYKIEGKVKVNGQDASEATIVTANDTIETLGDSKAIFVVGQDAFLLKQKSKLKLSGRDKFKKRLKKKSKNIEAVDKTSNSSDKMVVETLRLVTGGMLSVFGKTEHQVKTANASIGIRGTGVYFESEAERSYVCTCYGVTEIASLNDPASSELIRSKHHDAPRYIFNKPQNGKLIAAAPFKNHSDLELMLLEEIVGRTPPFSVSGDNYNSPRRGY